MDRIEKLNDLDFKIEWGKASIKDLKQEYIECNTFQVDMNLPVYRIMSFKDLKRTILNRQLSMSKPKTWPDPFETFLLNSKSKLKDGRFVGFEQLRDKLYCQCWSLREECEGLWNRHSNDFSFVKIKSTPKLIMNSMYDVNNPFHSISYYAGKVDYVEQQEILNLFTEEIGKYFRSDNAIAIIHSLLIKRMAFDYEKEVRFIFNIPNNDKIDYSLIRNPWNLSNDYYCFDIDINEVIKEITFHPYSDINEYSNLKEEIKELGYTGDILRSDLFTRYEFISKF